jgi:DNA-binding Xre family transcriptional regulator
MAVQFALKELMARKERQTGQPCTYEIIRDTTNISLNTLSLIANNKIKWLPVNALDSLLNFFECTPNDFIIYVKNPG